MLELAKTNVKFQIMQNYVSTSQILNFSDTQTGQGGAATLCFATCNIFCLLKISQKCSHQGRND